MSQGSPGVAELARRRVLIVDDNSQVRQELRTLLPLTGDIEIVGEAEDGLQAIRLAQALQPDVVLLDLEMPVLDGYEAMRQIKADLPSCRVVTLTVHAYEAARLRAMEAGADVFLEKGAPLGALVQAIYERRE